MRFVYSLEDTRAVSAAELVGLVGGKAANLAMMAAELHLPVPPAFVITTEACRAFLSTGWPEGLNGELEGAMARLESGVGRRFGDPENPLLVSVRSGAPVSMPGMMDTILNLGLNDETMRGLARVSRDPEFAADCRRRFTEMFTTIVAAESVPDDPWRQLRAAVEAVFRSWHSERARAYRARDGISDDLGTAVTVQAMVFGNWGADSAAGVLFTRNPATGEPTLYGDVLFASQGEDVVAGTHLTQPISILDATMPGIGRELRKDAKSLERHFADLCDIEFTIEQGKLWLLQVRVGKRSPRAALRMAVDMADDPGFPLSRAQAVERVAGYLANPPMITTGRGKHLPPLAVGLPASPGVATGEIATSASAAVAAAEGGRPAILVRAETSPNDVPGMAKAVGVLTSRGGLASHAAVVARGWGIPAVVGAEAVEVGDHVVQIGGRRLQAGDTITIDGGTGEVFAGVVPGNTAIAPEAATLLGWARELGMEVHSTAAKADQMSMGNGAVTPTDVIRALLIKGSSTVDGLAASLLSNPEQLRPQLESLTADGLVDSFAGGFRLTTSGKTKGEAHLAADQLRWGDVKAGAALDAFATLDHRMKEAVTAWQLREVDGAQLVNDHSDAAYDTNVLDRLAGLHHDAAAWLSSIGDAPPAVGRYLIRLERALAMARAGDQRFVASPRVDSFHGVWFELHEDLILLAGRSRADEAAAGRA
ncbi:MAG TPA: pyruvate, phosphate dikinase [Candidatus Dormibacteraeota bacterium]|nr:pyruvate, phosphate dikinase [Candidatus Dormibacteraeota bacterium]